MRWENNQLVDVPRGSTHRLPSVNEFGVISHHQRGGGLRQTLPIPRDPQCILCEHDRRQAIKYRLSRGARLADLACNFKLDRWFSRTIPLLSGVDLLRRNLKHHPQLMKQWLEASKPDIRKGGNNDGRNTGQYEEGWLGQRAAS